MARWQTAVFPATSDGALTGRCADPDRRARLRAFVDMLARADAERARAQQQLDTEVAAARRQGQDALANEALNDLAERRAPARGPHGV